MVKLKKNSQHLFGTSIFIKGDLYLVSDKGEIEVNPDLVDYLIPCGWRVLKEDKATISEDKLSSSTETVAAASSIKESIAKKSAKK